MNALLEAEGLSVRFGVSAGMFAARRYVRAVSEVDLSLLPGETLALVGESGSGKTTFARALLGLVGHTRALLDSVPRIGAGRRVPGRALQGDIPSPMAPPPGCAFHPRCARASAVCREVVPVLRAVAAGHSAACHHPLVEGAA